MVLSCFEIVRFSFRLAEAPRQLQRGMSLSGPHLADDLEPGMRKSFLLISAVRPRETRKEQPARKPSPGVCTKSQRTKSTTPGVPTLGEGNAGSLQD